MKVHVMTGAKGLRAFQDEARRTAAAGFAGLVVTESGRTAYLSCAAAALTGVDLDLATGVAVAFPRSPMITASTAWELAEVSGGRFRLGLGTQVRAHVERRYGVEFDPPGPRLRDYVRACKAVFAAFRGEKLAFESEHYNLSLLPAMWNPGPIDVPDPPIDIAAVNPWMVRMAGEFADGVHVHPLNTPTYVAETLQPNLAQGAARAGRHADDLVVLIPSFTIVGDTDKERAHWREMSRTMVAFYGSTPNYGFVFDQLGREGTTAAIRERQKVGDMAGMASVIDDDLLDHFVVEGTWDDLPQRIVERYAGIGPRTNVVLYHAGMTAADPRDTFERYGEVAKRVHALTGGP